MTPEVEAIVDYLNSIPSFIVGFYTFCGFFLGVFISSIVNIFDDLVRFLKRFILKKRLEKSSAEVIEHFNDVIDREDG